MDRPKLTLRPARVEDAPLPAEAERTIAATSGLLVSRPSELTDERFGQKIAFLSGADNGRYVAAETGGRTLGHGMLAPLPRRRCTVKWAFERLVGGPVA